MWFTHRKELAAQTRDMLRRAVRVSVAIPNWTRGKAAPSIQDGVAVFMEQTVSRRSDQSSIWNEYDDSDLMIIDEAHRAVAEGCKRAIRQWPGRVLGMTATPWRLSRKEGFDHLFSKLICGPQVADLQSQEFLCEAQILQPPDEHRILGGKIGTTGDYTETGIEQTNVKEVMTARALEFWKEQASNRQTIIYAVSIVHAQNLAAVFNDAGIAAEVILGKTDIARRAAAISDFAKGKLKVLVNVAVVTEGFDLPDASCVVIARPTKSLTLYLQMVGRGLRPKSNGGNCLVLDLAGNALEHGLPEEHRKWSLGARGQASEGEAPRVWCKRCKKLSHAARHSCIFCGETFGKDCQLCGKWRARKWWAWEKLCNDTHLLVCDLCHLDTHPRSDLPYDGAGVKALHASESEERVVELLNEERELLLATKKEEQDKLHAWIINEEKDLKDDLVLERQFEDYLAKLPIEQRPRSTVEKFRLFNKWESERRKVVSDHKNDLEKLKARPIDQSAVFNNVQARRERERKASPLNPLGFLNNQDTFLNNQDTYTEVILVVLRRMGGEGKTKDVIDKVGVILFEKVNRLFNEDYQEGAGELREGRKESVLQVFRSDLLSTTGPYRNKVSQAHRRLRMDACCDANTPKGTWRLTAKGQELAEKYDKEPNGGEAEAVHNRHNDSDVTETINARRQREFYKTSPPDYLNNQDTYTKVILVVLRRMGDEGKTKDVIKKVSVIILGEASRLFEVSRLFNENNLEGDKEAFLSDARRDFSSSKSPLQNRMRQAHAKLKKAGYCDTQKSHGTWRLSPKGREKAEKYDQKYPIVD